MKIEIYNYDGDSKEVVKEFEEGSAFLSSIDNLLNAKDHHVGFYPTHPRYGSCWMALDAWHQCYAVAKKSRNLPNAIVNGTGRNMD